MLKRLSLLLWISTFVTSGIIYADGYDSFPALKIIPDEVELGIGDEVQLKAVYLIDDTTEVDTSVVWSAEPDTVISIDENGLVTGLAPGKAKVTAVLDTLTVKVGVKVKGEKHHDDNEGGEDTEYELYVSPYDKIITAGTQLSYKVFHKSETGEAGEPVAEAVTWELQGMPVGTISAEGILSTDSYGFALIIASLADGRKGSAFVIVSAEQNDTDINKITITKTSNNPVGYSVKADIEEGGIWTIGGLPSPMNILNGGKVYFPPECLSQDIRIHIDLPKFAVPVNDNVDFGIKGMVAGVDFQVFVDDALIEPFYFQIPFITGLVYKRGLLQKLDIDPSSLALYFVSSFEDGLEIGSSGISYTTLDYERNRIFATVAHMSTLAVIGKSSAVTGTDNILASPADFRLYQNYPNPFNPSTTIHYYLPSRQFVNLKVYDALGREIVTLVSQIKEAGHHEIKFPLLSGENSVLPSGIYFYRLDAGNYVDTRKMLLLK